MDSLGSLPAGWECKLEPKLSRIYFINHTAKSTTWEDPRLASLPPPPPYHVAISQPTSYFEETNTGSRWSSPVPSLRGFSLHRRGSSPRLGGSPRIAPSPTPPPRNRRNEPLIHFEPSTPSYPRRASGSSTFHHSTSQSQSQGYQALQEESATFLERPPSSYSTSSHSGLPSTHLVTCDFDTAYKTVCALFPTAPEPHIRHLFHKYHNRANLVASALQVEKFPFASEAGSIVEQSPRSHGRALSHRDGDTDTLLSIPDGKSFGIHSPLKGHSFNATNSSSPARTATPASLLKSNIQSSVGSLLTRSFGSPVMSMSPQMQSVRETSTGKAQRSPKMKLKYMKGIFPAADETILLDVLASCENNVQRASEKLMRKGFSRTPPPKPARQKWLEVKSLIEKRQRALEQQRFINFQHEMRGELQESPFPTPIMRTARPHLTSQEKKMAHEHLMLRFPSLPDRFLSWALEASNFEKEKAERLLTEIGPQTPEELKPFIANSNVEDALAPPAVDTKTSQVQTLNNNVEQTLEPTLTVKKSSSKEFRKSAAVSGSETGGVKPRKKNFFQSLLRLGRREKSYATSNKLVKGPNAMLAKGSNPGLLQSSYVPNNGPNAELRKGPNTNNATGSKGRAEGPNPSLARGSIWSRYRQAHVQFVAVEG